MDPASSGHSRNCSFWHFRVCFTFQPQRFPLGYSTQNVSNSPSLYLWIGFLQVQFPQMTNKKLSFSSVLIQLHKSFIFILTGFELSVRDCSIFPDKMEVYITVWCSQYWKMIHISSNSCNILLYSAVDGTTVFLSYHTCIETMNRPRVTRHQIAWYTLSVWGTRLI